MARTVWDLGPGDHISSKLTLSGTPTWQTSSRKTGLFCLQICQWFPIRLRESMMWWDLASQTTHQMPGTPPPG